MAVRYSHLSYSSFGVKQRIFCPDPKFERRKIGKENIKSELDDRSKVVTGTKYKVDGYMKTEGNGY
jgi:hypothetical protein